jgi:DNA-binding XRE family transcriptional regulator
MIKEGNAMDGKKLQKKLDEKGLTQTALGDTVGVTRQMIHRIIQGTKEPSLSLAKEIARTLDCKLDELLA